MPIYNYQCQDCGQHFEKLVRADSTPSCPHCSSAALEKQVSAPTAPGKSKAIIAANRARAVRAGHLSNYSKSD